jgi:hypothetical protein
VNYIKHTVAAHEHLRTRREATTLHIALYWALFFQWNAEYFDGGIELDHEATMKAARIGNRKTYRATLYDLDAWGLLSYQPSKSKHHASCCLLTDLSGAKVPQVKLATGGSNAPHENSLPGAVVPQALRAEVPPVEPPSGAVVPQDTVLVQTFSQTTTTNVSSGTKKKREQVFSGEGLSEVQVLDDTAGFDESVPAPGAAPKKKVAPKKKGVGPGPQAAPASTTAVRAQPRRRGGRPQRPELPFAESELATPEAFAAAFVGTDYALADLRYYHALVGNWRKDGEPPLRRDWKATATKFMLNDAADNRLKLAPGTQRHEPGANHPDPGARPAGSGYRSKYDA